MIETDDLILDKAVFEDWRGIYQKRLVAAGKRKGICSGKVTEARVKPE